MNIDDLAENILLKKDQVPFTPGLIMAKVNFCGSVDDYGWTLDDPRIVQGPAISPEGAPITYRSGNTQECAGQTWTMNNYCMLGHFGYMKVRTGVTYTFSGTFDDSFALLIDGQYPLKWHNNWTAVFTGTYTPRSSGWKSISIYLGQNVGGFGGSNSAPRWSIDGTTWHKLISSETEFRIAKMR